MRVLILVSSWNLVVYKLEAGFCWGYFLGRYGEEPYSRVVRDTRLWCRKPLEGCTIASGFHHPFDDLKTLCQPDSKWVPFSNQGSMRQPKDRGGLSLSSAVPKIQWVSNPHCPYGYGKP